jgi:hypothetical protein
MSAVLTSITCTTTYAARIDLTTACKSTLSYVLAHILHYDGSATACLLPCRTSRGVNFTFHNHQLPAAEAEAVCNRLGGHLATYASVYEQYEVEQYLIAQGHLLPTFHRSYWLALARDDSLLPYIVPPFRWADNSATGPAGNYSNWRPHPPGLPYVGYCGVATAPEPSFAALNMNLTAAWLWDDEVCNATHAFMCRMAVNITSSWVGLNASTAVPGGMQAVPVATGQAVTLPTFYFNSTMVGFDDAQASCQLAGGHLAAYSDYVEQQAVEAYFRAAGFIISTFSGEAAVGVVWVWGLAAARCSWVRCIAHKHALQCTSSTQARLALRHHLQGTRSTGWVCVRARGQPSGHWT